MRGSLEELIDEYDDGVRYDAEYGDFEPNGPFYLALAKAAGGPVLEIACGTGAIAVPLAQAGVQITGIDIAPAMLERARAKSAGLPATWIEADGRSFNLGRRFKLIYLTGNAFQGFLTNEDQVALLERVREHLEPDGVFAFESRHPHLRYLATDADEEEQWHTFTDEQEREVHVSGTHHYDPLTQTMRYVTYRRWTENVSPQEAHTTVVIRFTFPMEMKALLARHGFTIKELYGDWDRSPLTPKSRTMIHVCIA